MELLKKLLADRTAKTLFLAVILMLVMGSIRPDKPKGLYPGQYWAQKAAWNQCCDMVLTGDSRVLMGLSPSILQEHLGKIRICNFGFAATKYTEQYLNSVEQILDPDSKIKTIVLGISPHSLTTKNIEGGNFFETASMSQRDIFVQTRFAPIIFFFEPMSFKDALHGLFPSLAESRTTKHFYPDGWISVHKEPINVKRELKKYQGFYEERQVSEEYISNLMKKISEWTDNGIYVFGFLPPTCQEMYELEKSQSGLDIEDFARRFGQAGGKWINTNPTAYTSFDGSHLQIDGAERFSGDMGESLKNILFSKEIFPAASAQAK